MFKSQLHPRLSLPVGLLVLLPVLGFASGCGEQESSSISTDSPQQPSQQAAHEHDGHDHDHGHADDASERDGDAASSTEPVALDADAQAAVDQIVSAYLTVQQRLAEDEMDGVQPKLTQLHDAAHDLMHSDAPGIEQQARAVANPVHHEPTDLEDARSLFKDLSVAVIDLVEMAPPSDEATTSLFQAHCPMAEADWLQSDDELVNPYMGQAMLRCGEIKQAVKSARQQ